MVRLPAFLLTLGGVALSLWGLWVLYIAITNRDPQSEIPNAYSWIVAFVLLLVGGGLLWLGRISHRRGAPQS